MATKKIRDFFTAGDISKTIPGYILRDGQVKLAENIGNALDRGKILFAEAGTGIGKSFAYLIPSVLYALENETPVVISTETKTLQNQLISKDIPAIRKILNQDFKSEVAFGSSNYLCKRRLNLAGETGNFGTAENIPWKDFYAWEKKSPNGLREDAPFTFPSDFWSRINREPNLCMGKNCPNFGISFYFREKEKWKNADILVVNHHLLAAHFAQDGKLLPEFSHLIIDEAHTFPEILGDAFQGTTSLKMIEDFLIPITSVDKKRGLFPFGPSLTRLEESVRESGTDVKMKAVQFFNSITGGMTSLYSKVYRETGKISPDGGELENSLKNLTAQLLSLMEKFGGENPAPEVSEKLQYINFVNKEIQTCVQVLKSFRCPEPAKIVNWISMDPKASFEEMAVLNMRPLNEAEIFANKFLPNLNAVVFTSATLCTKKGDFSLLKEKTGIKEPSTLSIPSPFPYQKNAILFLPENIRDPSAETDLFHVDAARIITELSGETDGASLVLFTSNKSLDSVIDLVRKKTKLECYSQLEDGPVRAKNSFLSNPKSILFGVASYWQGLDIRGDQLRSVIIIRLPFQPPGDPVLEAKIELMKKKNRNPFMELQLPEAILSLKQGIGRLIRSETDTGIITIIDPRIKTKYYGKSVIESLPPAKIIHSFVELQREFKNLPKYNIE